MLTARLSSVSVGGFGNEDWRDVGGWVWDGDWSIGRKLWELGDESIVAQKRAGEIVRERGEDKILPG